MTERHSVAGTGPGTRPAQRAPTVPILRTLTGLIHDPIGALRRVGQQSQGRIVRINLGPFRPYLVTHPDHVQHVLKDNVGNYVRQGMLWQPLRPLIGYGIVGEGALWASRRRLMQPLFTARSIDALAGHIAAAVAEAVDEMSARSDRDADPLDTGVEMGRIIYRVMVRAFFGNRISVTDSDRLAHAIATAFSSLGARMVLPFVPPGVPLPGDRSFRRAVRVVDDIIYPLVRECRRGGTQPDDIVSLLCRSEDDGTGEFSERHVRDDIVAMFVGGTETTAVALTWLWVALDRNPDVLATLTAEVDRVVGRDRPAGSHLPDLRYTRMVIQETLRLYPPAWVVPRVATEADVIDGTRIQRGATILMSPLVTHRLPQFWPQADEFLPDRWAPQPGERRHRYAYYPFIGGVHQCLGLHLVTTEAQFIVATMLGRFTPRIVPGAQIRPRAAVTLRPRRRVPLHLRPPAGALPRLDGGRRWLR